MALAIAGNTLIMWGISQAINGLYELSQASDKMAQRAGELSSSFALTKTDIEGYKTQIDQLYATINSNTSSIEEVTNARRELLNVQIWPRGRRTGADISNTNGITLRRTNR